MAGRARRAVRGRAVPGARRCPAGRGRRCGQGTRCRSATWTAGCRRRIARSRCARTAARTGSTASCRRCSGRPRSRRRRSRSSSATCRSSTTSTRSSPRSCTACPRRSSSSTTTAAASSRSSPRRRPPSPGPACPDRYEELFGTPHGIDVAPIVTALGGEHVPVVDRRDLRAQVERSVGCPGVQVLELRTDRARNVVLHREVAAVVARGDPAMSRLDVDGLRWEVRARGTGTPLLLIHGFTGRGHVVGGSCRGVRALVPGDRRGPAGPRAIRHPATRAA